MLTVIFHRTDEGEHTPAFIDLPASRWDVLEAKGKLYVDNLSQCASVGNLYFEDSDPTILQVYDGQSPKEPDWIFKVSLHNPDHPAEDRQFIELALPATGKEISAAVVSLGLRSLEDASVVSLQSRIARFGELPYEHENVKILADLADQITTFNDQEFVKFLAIVEYEGGIVDCSQLYDLAISLDEYSFDPSITVQDIREYGFIRYECQAQTMTQAPLA